ncbi:hypothetical protein E1180_00720 [Roseibium denhamense]|nr:hypothetical protein [Roseibium denhamense]MTI04041.1 hypothetical protein [Roseibium denhamense]
MSASSGRFLHRSGVAVLTSCLCLLLAAACTAFPEQELTSYREAYLEAEKAGDLLYDELSAAVIRAGQAPAGSNCVRGTRAPACFDPDVARNSGKVADIPSIAARRTALAAVANYNLAIVDLLEGKRGDALSERIVTLSGIAGDLLILGQIASGPLPALVGGQSAALLGNLVKQLDAAVSAQQARETLIANEALVEDMLQALIDDTPGMYRLYQSAQGKYAVEVELAGGTGNKAARAEYAKIGAFHDQLTAYVKLLDQTRASFRQLLVSLKNGTPTTADVRANIRTAIEIRAAAEAFWSEVRKASQL